MNILIGDIGNTVTKISLVDYKIYKIKKLIYLDSKKILSTKYLKGNLSKLIRNKNLFKFALFSSVVPTYHYKIKNFLLK